MMLSVSRYVADKDEQRLKEAEATNEEKLQAAAQALVLQARELANKSTDDFQSSEYDNEKNV
jgi:hypothetical protein